jgi:hypothetical protein
MIGPSQKKKKLKLWEKVLCEDVMPPFRPTYIGEKGRALDKSQGIKLKTANTW